MFAGAANIFLRLSAYQLIEFDSEQEAVDYYNSGTYHSSDLPIYTYSDAVPTAGTWAVGDMIFKTTPVVGQPKGWRCTVAGTPGTWVTMGNL
jgi:hypothetical protein